MPCPRCNEEKVLSVAVNRDGLGRETVVPSPCRECQVEEMRARAEARAEA
jgi:transcription elongation factor Elf1